MTPKETLLVGWIVLIFSLESIFQVQPVHSLGLSYPCADGYTGRNCYLQCLYPAYGYRCRKICSCSPHLCHHINGCPPPAERCPAGFFGRNCEFGCLYPRYGLGCQKLCACSRKRCNTSTGCQYTRRGTNNQNFDENKPFVIERQKTPYYTSAHSIRLASHRNISGNVLKINKVTVFPFNIIQWHILTKADTGSASLSTNLNITLIKPTPTTGIPVHTSLTTSIKTSKLKSESQLSREHEKMKGIAKKLEGDSAFKDIPETSKNKWIEIGIISVGVLVGVLLLAHLLVSFMQRNLGREMRNSRNC